MGSLGRLTPLIAAIALIVAGCASDDEALPPVDFEQPETALDYEIEIDGVSDDDVRDLMEKALALYRQQERGAQSLAFLRRRAQGDVATAQKILRSFGWYEAEVDVKITPPEEYAVEKAAAEAEAEAAVRAAAPPRAYKQKAPRPEAEEEVEEIPVALARLVVVENRRYTLASHDFLLIETGAGAAPVVSDAAALGSPVDAPAAASLILQAESSAIAELRAAGRPYASRIGRDAEADPETAELRVQTTIATGDFYVFGDVVYEGAEGVDREYLATYLPWKAGETVDPARMKAFQNDLIDTDLFNGAAVDVPEEPPVGGVAPIIVRMEERDARTVTAGVRYDSDVGPAVRGGFEHRNLYGSNETFNADAFVGLEEQSLGFRYREPQWGRPGQDLVAGLDLRHIDDKAFEEFGATFGLGLERELSDQLKIGFGGLVEFSRTETNDDGVQSSRLIGLPFFVEYDSRDDALDPSKGVKARSSATPYAGVFDGDPVTFLSLDNTASTYFDLTGEKSYILALRGRLGSIITKDISVVSPSRRFYSGGGGSVRGYEERAIGPLDSQGDPDGGLSVVEVGAEMRARVATDIGVAAFVEAASVSEEVVPVFDEGVQVAIGGGVRYFSPIGPIRFDLGFPVNGRDVDDNFQFYISIGQAF